MKRKLRMPALFLALLLFASLLAPAALADYPYKGEGLDGQVVILHTNDSHGHVNDNMGFAAVAALKKAYEEAGAEVLLLDAGDTFHGMPFATLDKGGYRFGIFGLATPDTAHQASPLYVETLILKIPLRGQKSRWPL